MKQFFRKMEWVQPGHKTSVWKKGWLFAGVLGFLALCLAPVQVQAQGALGAQATLPRWQPGWAKWMRDPSVLELRMEISVKADTSTPFTITAGSASITNVGIGCSTYTDPISFEVPVKLKQPFQLRLIGSNVLEANITLVPPASTELRASRTVRGRPVTPARVNVYVDGTEVDAIIHVNTNSTCSQYETTWTIEVRPDKNAPRQNSSGRDVEIDLPETQAPGDADWPEIGPGRHASPGIAPIKWSVGVGRLFNGKSAGRILYQEQGLSSNSYTPASLLFYQPIVNTNDVVVVTNASITNVTVLRQIKGPQTLVDIPTNTANSTELRFFLPAQVSSTINTNTGCYDILTNSPFVVWRISNPDQNSSITRRLRITEERPGFTSTNEIAFDSTNQVWLLTRGSGPEQYRETRSISFELDDSFTNDFLVITNRIETNRISDAVGRLAYEAVETYTLFEWGWELAKVLIDPSTNALLTTYYYENVGGDIYGKLKRIEYPDGSWEARHYDAPGFDAPFILSGVDKPSYDTSVDEFLSSSPDFMAITYQYGLVEATGEWFVKDTDRNGPGGRYRYDTIKKQWVWSGLLEREGYQMGWLPDCLGAVVREGALRFSVYAAAAAAGWPALTLTNYHVGATNTYEFGTWASSSFSAGTGTDWRRSSISGLGTLYDPEADPAKDSLDILPGKSTKASEIRRQGVPIARELYAYADTVPNGTSFTLLHRDFLTNDSLGRVTGLHRIDGATGVGRTLFTGDWRGTNTFPHSLIFSEADEYGVSFNYTYDSLRRLKTSTMAGANGLPDYTITFNYDACDRVLSVITNAGSLTLSNQYAYDLAGRVTRITDHTGSTTLYDYPDNGLSTSITYPGGATYVKTRYLDGEPKSETGTAVVAKHYRHEYFDNQDSLNLIAQKHTNALARTTYLGPDGTNSARKISTVYNLWDFPVWEVRGSYAGDVTQYYFYANSDDNLTSTESPGTDPALPPQHYAAYDSENHPSASWIQIDGIAEHTSVNPQPELSTLDRVTQTLAVYTNISGNWFRATNTYAYLTDYSATPTLVSSVRQRLNGFQSGVKSEFIMVDAHSNTLTSTLYVDRANKKLTEVNSSASSTLSASNLFINGLPQSQSTLTVAAPTLYSHDALRRMVQTITPSGATMSRAYDPANGRAISSTDFAGNTTSHEYYATNHLNSGRVKSVTAANGKKTSYEYTARGELWRTWGDVPYPEERIYSDFGELVELRTYRGGSGWNGTTWPGSPGSYDSTTWTYQAGSGLLLSKTDASSRSVSYEYNPDNSVSLRTWARGVVTTSRYSPHGDLHQVSYSDGTPTVTYTNWNRSGQPRELYDASGKHTLTFDYAGRLVSDYCPSGLVAGVTLVNHFHPQHGRDYLEVQTPGGTVHDDFSFDTFGRLEMVANGGQTANYGYLLNSDRLETTTFHTGGTPVMTTSRVWTLGERLASVNNVVGTGSTPSVTSHAYLYDAAQRRTQATLEDGSRWKYDYNDRNELSAGKRYWADWSPVSGQRFEYGYDNLGNRTNAASGGDVNGANVRATTYAVNALNQYTSVTTPGYKDVMGAALATNSVTVDGNATDRKGEYFHREVTVANGSAAVWQGVTIATGSTSSNGGFAFPKNVASPTYDYDGNLTYDGIWTYYWDGENRLKTMQMITGVSGFPDVQKRRLEFVYDQLGRRVQKIAAVWNGSTFTNAFTNRFVYDGWNLIAELDHLGNPLRSYAWGKDLSGGTAQDGKNAGGVGGLLMVRDHAASATHFVGYDGNGNVTSLVKSDGSMSARYEFSPFGELIRSTGPLARLNPFRWSTKFTDEESGLVYYGYRYYSVVLGRWVNRDPLEEKGGVNLYGAFRNDPISQFDTDGRFLFISLLMGSTTESQMRTTAGAVYARIVSTIGYSATAAIYGGVLLAQQTVRLAQAGLSAASSVNYYVSANAFAAQQYVTQAGQSAYVQATVFFVQNQNLVYESAAFFSGFMTPGPGTGWEGVGSALSETPGGQATQQEIVEATEAAFDAFLDFFSSAE